jgi:hypothetical protein
MTEEDIPSRLRVLIAEYEACRDDDRTYNSAYAVLFGVASTLLGLIAAATTQACGFTQSGKACVHVPDSLIAIAPLLPVVVFAYAQLQATIAVVRNYYMRALEEELREYAQKPFSAFGAYPVPQMSFIGIVNELSSLRRGRVPYRLLANFIFMAVIVVFGGLTIYIGAHLSYPYRIEMAFIYGPLAVLLISETIAATLGGQSLFVRAALKYVHDETNHVPRIREAPTSRERNLRAYLLVPRPEDFVKWLIAPGAFVVVAWAAGTFADWHRFVLLWLVFEYLIYNARYQWNDARGIDEDREHSERISRSRLPTGPDQKSARTSVVASLAVAMLRLTAAVMIGIYTRIFLPVVTLIALVFGFAAAYEALRSSATATKRQIYLIWIIVGSGYAIRAAIGVLSAGLPENSLTIISALAFFAFFGMAFVLLTWVLEATSYCRKAYIPETGAWNWYELPPLRDRPHIALLLGYAGYHPKPVGSAPAGALPPEPVQSGPAYCGEVKALQEPASMRAPWNLAFLISAALSGLTGYSLALARHPVTPFWAVTAMVLGALGSLAVALASHATWRVLSVAAVACALSALTLPAAAGAKAALACPIPWIVISALYIMFCYSSYSDLKKFGVPAIMRNLSNHLARVLVAVARTIVGRRTWSSLYGPASR